MTKKMNNKPSAKRKLLPAIGMLTVSAMMLSSSTYAWFTMNKYVTVTGMEVKTSVSSNLLISHGASNDTAKKEDSTFTTADATLIKAWLQPVSTNTADSSNFWYTLDAKADGSKIDDKSYVDYDATGLGTNGIDSAYANAFSQAYGVAKSNFGAESGKFNATTNPADGAVGYVDYAFQLKATNTSSDAESIYLTQLDLTYAGANDTNKAFRVAVFAEKFNSAFAEDITTFDNNTNANYKGIYAPSGSVYQTSGAGVSGASATTAITDLLDAGQSDVAIPLATIGSGQTEYYKVVVRLWLEGEDKTCTSETFATLTENWKLDLRLDLGNLSGGTQVNSKTPVTALTMKQTTSEQPEQP